MIERRGATIELDGRTLTGVVANYGVQSLPIVEPGVNGGKAFRETIAAGAFDASLRSGNKRLLVRHDPAQLLANTKSGRFQLIPEARSLRYAVELPDTGLARDAWALVEARVLGEMSFAFTMLKDLWRGSERDLLTADFHEASLVETGAYPGTSAEARALDRIRNRTHLRLRLTAWQS